MMLWDMGLRTQLTARALDKQGRPIPGAAFEWTSANPAVATVVDGMVTATGDGWTEVIASAGGVSKGASIVVATPDGPKDRTDCIACHADAYLGKHGGSDTPETCLQCHTGPTWTGGELDHAAVADGFELLGVHALLSCAACHEADGTPKYPGVADDQCIACHQSDYDGRHGGSGTPTTCLQCHTRDGWGGADFDHAAVADGFELLGVHALLSCAACHEADGTPKYPGVADDQCIACHQSDYDGRHGGSGTPTTCLQCHTRDGWGGADFDHAAVADGFELLGVHALLSCAACHEADGTPKYPGVADDQCIACHQSDYDGRHGGSGTPTTCLQCHTRDGWDGADFDHTNASGGFDLLGAHTTLTCTACHEADGTPKYPGVADDQCIACHQSDYDGRHGGSGYPATCLTCHTRDAWSDADFDHDAQYFPISAGKHQGKWSGCATCHVNASDYSDFSCFACHPHDQTRMDDKHSEVSGYGYDSSLCYACHPDGRG